MVNPYNKYIKQYQANNVNTASPEKLMLLLLDGALQFLQKAKSAIETKALEEKSKNIEGARKIFRELMRTIDLENGNEVSKSLFKLYNRMTIDLLKANVKQDLNLLNAVIEDTLNIRWAFQKAIDIQNGKISVEDALKEQSDNDTQNNGTT